MRKRRENGDMCGEAGRKGGRGEQVAEISQISEKI